MRKVLGWDSWDLLPQCVFKIFDFEIYFVLETGLFCRGAFFRMLIQRYVQYWVFAKEPANSFSTAFGVWCFKKNVSYVIFY